jgi:hypothetical protein
MSRGRARPQLLRVEQTRSKLVLPAPWRSARSWSMLKGSKGSRLMMGWTAPPSLIEFVRQRHRGETVGIDDETMVVPHQCLLAS